MNKIVILSTHTHTHHIKHLIFSYDSQNKHGLCSSKLLTEYILSGRRRLFGMKYRWTYKYHWDERQTSNKEGQFAFQRENAWRKYKRNNENKIKKKTVWKRRNNGRSVPTSRTEPLFTPNSPVTFCSVTSIPARALFLVAFCERWDEALVYPDKDAFCSLPEVNHVSTITRVGI